MPAKAASESLSVLLHSNRVRTNVGRIATVPELGWAGMGMSSLVLAGAEILFCVKEIFGRLWFS